jgi:hypothetical protein
MTPRALGDFRIGYSICAASESISQYCELSGELSKVQLSFKASRNLARFVAEGMMFFTSYRGK